MSKLMSLSVLAASLAMSACSTCTDNQAAYNEGWRRAQVVAMGDSGAVKGLSCRPGAAAAEGVRRYVVTSYSYGGNPNLRTRQVVAVSDDQAVAMGDQVYVNARDCQAPLKKVL